jgi:hypothetical protein
MTKIRLTRRLWVVLLFIVSVFGITVGVLFSQGTGVIFALVMAALLVLYGLVLLIEHLRTLYPTPNPI